MIQSSGVLVKGSPTTLWSGTTPFHNWSAAVELGNRWSSYGELYRKQVWVSTVVNKRARSVARLPLKVYERGEGGRPEARDHPYARLLRRPNERHSPFKFWLWSASTYDVYGEFFWIKARDRGGRPVQLIPLHPTCMHEDDTDSDGRTVWRFENGTVRLENIPDEDLVHPTTYNPDTFTRGLSPLEPLRRTLEFEDAAQRAQSSFWRNGARPGTALTHPGNISQPAQERLKLNWNAIASGADNTGVTVVLEEGMEPKRLTITNDEAQYIESRKLNREEVCAAYDVPPPVVHILDHATFSNITEQMRSMYRDTMAPLLKAFESELETQLRASVRRGGDAPDFGDDVYAEFLLDEVLRGDFEARADAMQKAINSGQLTPAEAREMENRPFIDGSDRLFINSTLTLVDNEADDDKFDLNEARRLAAVGQLIRAGFDPQASLLAVGLDPIPHMGLLPVTIHEEATIPTATVRSLMGRLSRAKTLDDVDDDAFVAGLNGHSDLVLGELIEAKARGEDVPMFRDRLRALAEKE